MKLIRPVFSQTKPRERTNYAEKFKKLKKQITNIAKTQITEAIKIIIYFLNNNYFYYNFYSY